MTTGVLWAMSLPGLIVLLVVLAVIERVAAFAGLRKRLPWRKGNPASATGLEELDAFFSGGKRLEMEDRKAMSLTREDEESGAPPRTRVDLRTGVVRLVVPPRDGD